MLQVGWQGLSKRDFGSSVTTRQEEEMRTQGPLPTHPVSEGWMEAHGSKIANQMFAAVTLALVFQPSLVGNLSRILNYMFLFTGLK